MYFKFIALIWMLLLPISACSKFSSNDPSIYFIFGDITRTTTTNFFKHANKHKIKTVVLRSGGGYLLDSEIIASYIRNNNINTLIEGNSYCFSACTLIFQSGIRRIVYDGGTLMYHSATTTTQGVSVKSVYYTNVFYAWLVQYGLNIYFVRFLRKPAEVYIGAKDALRYGIATEIR
jgi:hypothetical protein